jgi:hypothetical protein
MRPLAHHEVTLRVPLVDPVLVRQAHAAQRLAAGTANVFRIILQHVRGVALVFIVRPRHAALAWEQTAVLVHFVVVLVGRAVFAGGLILCEVESAVVNVSATVAPLAAFWAFMRHVSSLQFLRQRSRE